LTTSGGDLRERVESYADGYFGLADASHTTYLLSRALLDADLHFEDGRAFVQLGNAVGWNRQPAALPTDDNQGDVQQAFIEYAPQIGSGKTTVRLGRFELKFGEGLIVSPREGPNIRQAWDGAWGFYSVPGLRVDVLAVRPVEDKAGWFEDTANPNQQLWGVYVTATPTGLKDYAIDASGAGIERDCVVISAMSGSSISSPAIGESIRLSRCGRRWCITRSVNS
jgi:hypothetical protein